jgi:osmotically-inducible protein OsmY
VNAAISDDEKTAEYPIQAVNDSGVITLSGQVPSADISAKAEEIAEGVEGVVEVINDLTIAEIEPDEDLIVPPIDPTKTSSTSSIP